MDNHGSTHTQKPQHPYLLQTQRDHLKDAAQLKHTSHSQRHKPSRVKPHNPIRLVDTKTITHTEWLTIRQHSIGSSDAAAALGLNPYQSQLELWLNKTGKSSPWLEINSEDETSPTYWGHILEPIVATHYSQKTGHKVQRINAMLQHPKHPWMTANIDRRILGNKDAQILECKTAGIHGSKLWRDGVPHYVHLQVMHQLAVTGWNAADVAVLLGGQDLQIHRIERDETQIKELIQQEEHFWQMVRNDIPPPADGSESAQQALLALYPQDTGELLDLTDNIVINQTFEELLSLRQTIAVDIKQAEKLKQTLEQAMGKHSFAQLGAGSISWKKSKDSVTLDAKKLLTEQPELLQQYPLTQTGSRRFVIYPKKQA